MNRLYSARFSPVAYLYFAFGFLLGPVVSSLLFGEAVDWRGSIFVSLAGAGLMSVFLGLVMPTREVLLPRDGAMENLLLSPELNLREVGYQRYEKRNWSGLMILEIYLDRNYIILRGSEYFIKFVQEELEELRVKSEAVTKTRS